MSTVTVNYRRALAVILKPILGSETRQQLSIFFTHAVTVKYFVWRNVLERQKFSPNVAELECSYVNGECLHSNLFVFQATSGHGTTGFPRRTGNPRRSRRLRTSAD